MADLILKPGREKSLLRRHPWVFSGAIERLEYEKAPPAPGETVRIVDSKGAILATAAHSPESQIGARVWSWRPEQVIDPAFLRQRLESAFALRADFLGEQGGIPEAGAAQRLVHAESDGLPGLILDRYGDLLIFQFLSAGAEYWRKALLELSLELTGCQAAFERSDVEVRGLEGLALRKGPLAGERPPSLIKITENGLHFWVDVVNGQKTGFYLDQRENRAAVRALAGGRCVLDCFAYTGGFALSALAGGADRVRAVEASGEALRIAKENLRANSLDASQVEWLEADVFQALRALRDRGSRFDMIILDPPKFAATAAQAQKAARGYKDINLLAFKLLQKGGILVTFSCSGGVTEDLFQKIVAGAALDAGVQVRLVRRLHQAPDHPVALNFPEGAYLKGFVLEVA